MFGIGKARVVTPRGKIESREAANALLRHKGDVALVERGVPRMLVMRCPCGCGDDLLINLDRRAGKAWRFYLNGKGLTLYPSYWRDSGCGSHFIVWNSQIYWCSSWDDGADAWNVPQALETLVLDALPCDRFVSYVDVADRLNLIPWDVLQACRQLVGKKLAVSGPRAQDGTFRRTS